MTLNGSGGMKHMTIGEDLDRKFWERKSLRFFYSGYHGLREGFKEGISLRCERKGDVLTGMTFPDMKPTKTTLKKSRVILRLTEHSCDLKRINGSLVFPDVRVPRPQALLIIEDFDRQISELEKNKKYFIQDDFMAWDFLTYEQARQMFSDRLTPEQREKNKVYYDKMDEIAEIILGGKQNGL